MNRIHPCATPLALAGVLLLAACGFGETDDTGPADLDPAVAQALNAPLMTDPDLTALNEANAALTGSTDHSLPLPVANPEAIRDAQDRAIALVGGHSALAQLPQPEEIAEEPGDSPLVLLEDVATRVSDRKACFSGLSAPPRDRSRAFSRWSTPFWPSWQRWPEPDSRSLRATG